VQHEETEAVEVGQLRNSGGAAAKARGRMDRRTRAVVAVAVAEGEVGMEVEVGPQMESEDATTGESHLGDDDHDGGGVRGDVRGDVHGDVRAYVDACDPLRGHASQPS
jgi:hypothetical protein